MTKRQSKAQRQKFDNVVMVDFDAPLCVRNVGSRPYRRKCGKRVVKESGPSHVCTEHWNELRRMCENLRNEFE
jgi:hypothetical protein